MELIQTRDTNAFVSARVMGKISGRHELWEKLANYLLRTLRQKNSFKTVF